MRPLKILEVVPLVVLALVLVVPLWRIAARMGYPGVLGLAALIPGANILLMWFLAFADWPILRELRTFRQRRVGVTGRRDS